MPQHARSTGTVVAAPPEPVPREQRKPPQGATLALVALLALTCAAFALRWRGLGYGLPHQTYRDGFNYFSAVDYPRRGEAPERSPLWGWYPHLVPKLVLLFDDPAYEPLAQPLDLRQHLERAASPWMLLREVAMALSVLAIPGAYALSRRFLSSGWSLVAAALVALNLLHISFGQQEKPHGPLSATVVLAVVAALRLRSRPSWGNAMLAALAAGLAIGTLQSGVAVLLPLGAAWLLRDRREHRAVALPLVASLAVIAVCFRYLYPFYFVGSLDNAVHEDDAGGLVLGLSGHEVQLSRFRFKGTLTVLGTLYSYDPALLVTSVVALAALTIAWWRRGRFVPQRVRLDLIVALAFALPYLLAICAYNLTFERFVMPLVPFFGLLGAAGLSTLAELLPSWSRPRVVAASIAALALTASFVVAWRLTSIRAAPDTVQQVAAWLERNTQPGARIQTMPYIDLPLLCSAPSLASTGATGAVTYWMNYQTAVPEELKAGRRFDIFPPKTAEETRAEFGDDPLEHLRSLGTEYVVIQDVGEAFKHDLVKRLHKQLAAQGELVLHVAPIGDAPRARGQVGIRYRQDLAAVPLALRLFDSHCLGNTLEVYRVAPQ